MQFITLAAYFLDAYTHSTETLVGYSIGRGSEKSFMQVVKNSFFGLLCCAKKAS